jgi:hypothetical protein
MITKTTADRVDKLKVVSADGLIIAFPYLFTFNPIIVRFKSGVDYSSITCLTRTESK